MGGFLEGTDKSVTTAESKTGDKHRPIILVRVHLL